VLGTAEVDDGMLRYAMDLAEKYTPTVVLLEDLDRIIQAKDISLSRFLNLLDGLKVLNGVLVIATCNEPDKLDPALIHRPSRFDRVWRFKRPKYEQRLELLHRKGETFFSESALETVADGPKVSQWPMCKKSSSMGCSNVRTMICRRTTTICSRVWITSAYSERRRPRSQENRWMRETVGFCASENGNRKSST
jgi:hypothetical protein